MKKAALILLLLSPLLLFAGGNPGNPLREFTVEDSISLALSNLEFAFNEGLLEDVLLQFSTNYSDANGVNFTTLSTMATQLLGMDNYSVGSDRFLMYNAEAQVNGNQAILTATILIQPPGSDEATDLLVAKDTITLTRNGIGWLVISAPNFVAKLGETIVFGLQVPESQQFRGGYNAQ